jgi:hypothetical protein
MYVTITAKNNPGCALLRDPLGDRLQVVIAGGEGSDTVDVWNPYLRNLVEDTGHLNMPVELSSFSFIGVDEYQVSTFFNFLGSFGKQD